MADLTTQAIHMNGGQGDTSYAKNSTIQKKIISFGNLPIEEAIADILGNNYLTADQSMGIADLGCSSGPNTLMLISEVIEMVDSTIQKMGKPIMPELRVYLNDLPSNDFNDIFMSLSEFYKMLEIEKGFVGLKNSCFISGVPGSFYGRLFPRKSLHLVHSAASLHWLSKVPYSLESHASIPLNKGKIYISKTSPQSVRNAYLSQFQEDFSVFLRSRSEELVAGGRMVLSFVGRTSADPSAEETSHYWELLAQALVSMASEGHFSEEKIHSFNFPYYAPSVEEVKTAFEEEGSFVINDPKVIDINACCETYFTSEERDSKEEKLTWGQGVAKTNRAVLEPMLEFHFGIELNMDELFKRYAEFVDDYISKARGNFINLVISAIRK